MTRPYSWALPAPRTLEQVIAHGIEEPTHWAFADIGAPPASQILIAPERAP